MCYCFITSLDSFSVLLIELLPKASREYLAAFVFLKREIVSALNQDATSAAVSGSLF